MRRIKLVIAYDGTNYCGWQLQPGKPTIEAKLNQALSDLLQEEITVIGASRTDSGVHARGNVAVFDTNSKIPADKFPFALNQKLPEDIRVQSSEEVKEDFHPRRVNCSKTYEYHILNRRIPLPMHRYYSYFIYHELEVEAMQRAANYLIGEHDFKSFCSVKTQVMDTVRVIQDIKIEKDRENIIISVTGNGFLYNMVRIIAGTLIEVGRGFYPPERVTEMLLGLDRNLAGPTAPPQGLVLVGIQYEEQE